MTVHYRIDSTNRIVIVTWPPVEPTIVIVRNTIEAILAEPARPARFRLLSDWRQGVEAPALSFVSEFLKSLRQWRAAGLERWATLVAPDAVAAYGTGRMLEIRAEQTGEPYRIFRDPNEAIRWLLCDGGDDRGRV